MRSAELGPICKTCGKVPPKTPDITWSTWKKRAYCGPECRPFTWTYLKQDELVDEIAALLGADSWLNIAARLDYKPDSLMRRLRRMGLLTWARALEREVKRQQREANRLAA